MGQSETRWVFRVVVFLLVAAMVVPVLAHATTYESDIERGSAGTSFGGRSDVLFVTTQGTATMSGEKSSAVAVNTTTGQVVWEHGSYERYFDIDPLDEDRVLFLGADGPHGANMWVNIVNWRTGDRVQRFAVPNDTHDVDYLGADRYAVADKEHDRLYVYNATRDEVVWNYQYANHFPDSAGDDESFPDTHVNDIDAVDNGSLFVASPRDFDRVMLVNRTSKQNVWTLGAEDDHDVLYEQHNPVLLSRDPPTVLVADSENDRVIEYRQTSSGWEQVWAYRGALDWPRDADRLPNGNTLVVDTINQRVLEVTPDREVVWEMTASVNPYDAELLSLGDEPAGPSMTAFRDQFDRATVSDARLTDPLTHLKQMAGLLQWVLPWNFGVIDITFVLTAATLSLFWIGTELSWRRTERGSALRDRFPEPRSLFPVAGAVVGAWLLLAPGVEQNVVGLWRGFGLLVVGLVLLSIPGWDERVANRWHSGSLDGQFRAVAAAAAVGVALVLAVVTNLRAFYLSAGALLALEAWRHVSVPGLPSESLVTAHALSGYLARAGALIPALVLVYLSRLHFTNAYLGLAVVILGSIGVSHTSTGPVADRIDRFSVTHVVAGVRTVLIVLSMVAAVAFTYVALQPTSLTGVYVGLVVVLLRNLQLLIYS